MQEKFTLNRFPSSHTIQEVSSGHTGREVHPTPVSTPALMPAKKGSAVILILHRVFVKSSAVPRFWKIPVNTEAEISGLQMPSLPVGAQKPACPAECRALLCLRRSVAPGGWVLGVCGRDGSRANSTGQALEREAETVRETGSQEESLRPTHTVEEAIARSSKRRGLHIITALKLASPVAVIAREGSGVSCRCCHPEGPVSACGYCFPIRASEAIDSC